MKNVRIIFQIDKDIKKNNREIYKIILFLNSNYNDKIRIIPLLDEKGGTSPRGINLFGSSEEAKRVKAEIEEYLKERSIKFNIEEQEIDVEGFVDYQLPVLSATTSEEMEQMLAEKSFNFSKLPRSLKKADQKAYIIWRSLKSGIAFYHLKMTQEAKNQLEIVLEMDPDNFEARHHMGLIYEMLDEPEKAVVEFKKALELDDESGATHFFLGNALQKNGDFEEAIEHYKTAIALDPDVSIIYNNLAWVFYQTFDMEMAIRAFEEAIVIDPELPFPHNGLGCILQEKGLYEEAIDEFKMAIDLYPEYSAAHLKLGWTYYLVGDYDEAVSQFSRAVEISTDFHYSISARYSLAHTFLALEAYYDAYGEFQEVVKMDPEFTEALYHLGLTALRLNLLKEAVEYMEKYIETEESVKPEVYKNLAFAFAQLNNYSKALKMCNQYLSIEPDDPEIYELMGGLYSQKEIWNKALKHFKKTLELNPNSSHCHFNLAWAYENLEKNSEAVEEYKKAIQLNPDFADAYSNLAMLYSEMDKPNEAVVIFEKALEIKPGDLNLLNNLGWFFTNMNKYNDALKVYRRALKLAPDSAMVHNNLGIVYMKKGEVKKAREKLNLALQLSEVDDTAAVSHFFLGKIELQQKNTDEALKHLRKSRDLDKKNPEVYYLLGKAYLEKGRTREYRGAFNKYLKLAPTGDFVDEVNKILLKAPRKKNKKKASVKNKK
ncbi:MAG: tetratricopeptide repeat protein [Vulcanimicrobiota bacterium]